MYTIMSKLNQRLFLYKLLSNIYFLHALMISCPHPQPFPFLSVIRSNALQVVEQSSLPS